jgi:hypothetical protein
MTKPKKNVRYFTSDTEKWIVEYNNSTNPVYRSEIFSNHIYYPFYKLVENIMHTFKLRDYTDVGDLEDLKHDVITVLLEEKIMKFDPTNGAKAYSYFGTIVKRWLINYNAQNYKRLKRDYSIDNIDLVEEHPQIYTELNEKNLSDVVMSWVESCYNTLDSMFPNPVERKVADAILTIFKSRKSINIFKKKALYIYIREITECETPVITATITKLKQNYLDYTKDIKDNYELVSF